MIPSSPQRGTNREYEDLRRAWTPLLAGLPPIDGFTVTEELPDIDEAGQSFIDYFEIGEPVFALMNELEKPGHQLDEYRFKLAQSRRRAIHDRLDDLVSTINATLAQITDSIARDSSDRMDDPQTRVVEESISEIERLLGDTTDRKGRWGDLHRHLRFSQGHDWHDIAEMDWPSVRADVEAASLSESDPLPVPAVDLGVAASAKPAGGASIGLNWTALDDDGFERLLFDLLRGFPSYQNVEWLMKTRAPDRGRDLSAERVIRDDGGTTRTERVIMQAKHWTSKSVAPSDITNTLATLPLWEPPVVRTLVIATSGRFTTDAVAIIEKHNADGRLPFIELWADSRLETQLSQRPDLVASYHLRS
ncbi:restriction endonuclease [Occultella glacieicola]|uniref:Restriction endonuclease n=1 Tax=Occultella glacieicola TaxID=2518684 RepID=A0ABY2E1M7_9MICO|nr:restriction endonuclease [Occultella glacieicola]TDE90077.1 restriction endonuclease [Occultella glacieicola]